MRQAMSSFFVRAGLLGLALLLLPRPALAAWPSDPLVNVPLCTAAGEQYFPVIVSDGASGAIVAWSDARSGSGDIYVQRVSASGTPLWTGDGVALCTAAGDQSNPTLVSDGAGGAIVTWNDLRSAFKYDIYAQRISASGVPQWTANGVALCTAGGHQQFPTITSDGAGGAIVAWMGLFGGNYDIYAQRVSGSGAPQWLANGVALCTAAGHQESPTLVPDGAGGAIVTWLDQRTGGDYTFSDIYAQRISAAGTPQWTANGVALCTAAGAQQAPTLVSDGSSGAIVTWFDGRSGDYDIYAQHISAAGAPQWTANGVALCTAAGEQAVPTIISDGAAGAIVAWRDYRSGSEYDIYTQRVSAAGTPQWAANGLALCTATGDQYDPNLAPDGAGGAIVTWPDLRNGTNLDVYAQRVSAAGTPQWAADGVALSTAAGHQNVTAVVSDGAGGAIVTWRDIRGGANYDIYAQRVLANGQLGGSVLAVPGDAPLAFALEQIRPNPARGGALTVRFTLASGSEASLELFDVSGRRVASRAVGALGAGSHALALGDHQHLAPGLYLVCLRQGGNVRTTRVAVLE